MVVNEIFRVWVALAVLSPSLAHPQTPFDLGGDLPPVTLLPKPAPQTPSTPSPPLRKTLQENNEEDIGFSESDFGNLGTVEDLVNRIIPDPYEDDDAPAVPLVDSFREDDALREWQPGNIFLGEQESFSEGFESLEIRVTVRLIRFKMREVATLIRECIETYFETHLVPNYRDVKQACVGLNFEVLFQNYEENMRRLRQILMELLRLKTARIKAKFLAEIDYFFDVLENFMERDLDLPRSMQVVAKTTRLVINEVRFRRVLEIAAPELEAFDELHKELKEIRTELQKMINGHTNEAEKYLDTLEGIIEEDEAKKRAHGSEESKSESSSQSSESKSKSGSSFSSSSGSSSSSSSKSSASSASSGSSSTGGHAHHAYGEEEKPNEKKEEEDDDSGEGEGDEKDEGDQPGGAQEEAEGEGEADERNLLDEPPRLRRRRVR